MGYYISTRIYRCYALDMDFRICEILSSQEQARINAFPKYVRVPPSNPRPGSTDNTVCGAKLVINIGISPIESDFFSFLSSLLHTASTASPHCFPLLSPLHTLLHTRMKATLRKPPLIILVWFGLYIYPDKPKPIYEESLRWAKRKVPPYYFLFLSHSLNTEFEHKGMNTEGCQWRPK